MKYPSAIGACAFVVATTATLAVAGAVPTNFLIPFSGASPGSENRLDCAYDNLHQDLWISSPNGTVGRYSLITRAFTGSWTVGGRPLSIDVSPDGQFVAVGDASGGRVTTIATGSGVATDHTFSATVSGRTIGVSDLAIASNGLVYLTPYASSVSAWESLRSLDVATGTFSTIPTSGSTRPRISSTMGRSLSGNSVWFTQGNTSDPYSVRFTTASGELTPTTQNSQIRDAKEDGSQFAGYQRRVTGSVASYEAAIMNGNFDVIAYLPDRAQGPAMYSLDEQTVYSVQRGLDLLQTFSSSDGSLISTYSTGDDLGGTQRLTQSTDGRYLFMQVGTGVRVLEIPSPPVGVAIMIVVAATARRRRSPAN